ncbi:MAG: hypothetical protein GVY19_08870 [Bacteroidetes bacterium]|nr:hypothetical protein [Bacteroidota bacterium]
METIFEKIQAFNNQANRSIVILDDDPTGCQTVYDVPVITTWDLETILEEFRHATPAFFILINTRSMEEHYAMKVNETIGHNLLEAARLTGRSFSVISRSDSTLRGHYPAEVNVLEKLIYPKGAMHCLIPAFFQGGRYTSNGTHYVMDNNKLIPAAETPFAQDEAFGFSHSKLTEWIEEKTKGYIRTHEVLEINLEFLREGGAEAVASILENSDHKACTVDAMTQDDLDVFALAAIMAEEKGKHFIYRTAASFINSYAGIMPTEPIQHYHLKQNNTNGCLFIAGSYVPKTTAQLEVLMHETEIIPVEIKVKKLLQDESKKQHCDEVSHTMNQHIAQGQDVLLYTSREILKGNDASRGLSLGNTISSSLVDIVTSLQIAPRYILAKGGITSHDIATKVLHVKRAMVMGQIIPGVPVWKLNENTHFPGLNYIIFPGNVGNEASLVDVYNKLNITNLNKQ